MGPILFKCTASAYSNTYSLPLDSSFNPQRKPWWLWCYCMPGVITTWLTNTCVDFISVWPQECGDSCLGLAFRIFMLEAWKREGKKAMQGWIVRHWGSVLPGTLWRTVWDEPQRDRWGENLATASHVLLIKVCSLVFTSSHLIDDYLWGQNSWPVGLSPGLTVTEKPGGRKWTVYLEHLTYCMIRLHLRVVDCISNDE